ncbi:MAG: energy transducer TonB [Crocinitomicaceae bacterium]|nr:energy transducer TonB [Crocinitomicaceae bacterium]
MKTAFVLFFLSISTVFAQVDCAQQEHNFSGKCDSYNEFTGVRSTHSYKKGQLHGKFEESFKNGQKRAEGSYKSGLLHGKFSSFYFTGERMTVAKFKSGSGSFEMYHENGAQKTIGQFETGKAAGTWKFFNQDGELTREMDIENDRVDVYPFLVGEQPIRNEMAFGDFFDSFDGSGFSFSFGGDEDSTFARMREQMDESMKQMQAQMEQMMQNFDDSSFMNSFQFDTTITFNGFDDMDGSFEFKSFGDSSFFKSFQFDTIFGDMTERSNPYFNSRENDLVDFPDTEPSYVGGEEAMKAYIETELVGINERLDKREDGTVFIEAIVEKDGSVSSPRIALGASSSMDGEALRIVQEMPLWKPATLDGQPVRSRCIIPVRFSQK